jgi:hypothetical protein
MNLSLKPFLLSFTFLAAIESDSQFYRILVEK